MKRLATAICVTLFATPAPAADLSAGSEGNGEAPRGDVTDQSFSTRDISRVLPKLDSGEASRAAPITDKDTILKALTAVGRSSDGKDLLVEPSDTLKLLVETLMGESVDNQGLGKTSNSDASRKVFGTDDRMPISNTKQLPFRTIGLIQAANSNADPAKQKVWDCSGTLIGPSTVLTAAHCLYNHEGSGWADKLVFVPGLNGPGAADAPFGVYGYEDLFVLRGFIDNYQTSYDSVVQWDLGIIILKQPIGDSLGWLAYANYDKIGDFSAHIVGYPGDKPLGTMWRSSCMVLSESISDEFMEYDCDTFPGSSGSSVYAYDEQRKQQVVVSVNVAESDVANTAVRINAAYYEWINNLKK